MEKSKRGTITRRIILGVVIGLALIYIVFLFVTTNFLGTNNIVTETAYRAKAYDVIKTTALVVRDEAVVNKNASGVLVYNVSDGNRVTADGVIATVYQNEQDVVALNKIQELNEKIAYLESLNNVTTVNIGLDTVNSQINERILALLGGINRQTFDYIGTYEDELMSSIYRKQIITGEQRTFDDKIAQLMEERRSLESAYGAPIGEIKTASSGYFVSAVDGYENCFDVNALDEITYSQLNAVSPQAVNEDAYAGKIIKGVNWYLVCPVSEDEAINISHNSDTVTVRLPYATSEEIPAKVVCVNTFSGEEKSVAVLECNFMSASISKIRNESVEIAVKEYEGLKFSKSALHDDFIEYTDENNQPQKKKVQGVYVEYGNELIFKQVHLLYSGEEYVICDEHPSADTLLNGKTVTLYDKVVIEGSDLFDGKLLS